MYRHHHWPSENAEDKTAERQTGSLGGLIIVLLLLIGGLFLVHQLRSAAQLQDCVLSGRSTCDVLVAVSQ